MDNGQLELCPRFVTIWGLSFQGLNNKNLLPIHTIQNIDYRPVLTLVLVLIKQYSYSCNNQVLGLTHITRTRTCTRKSGTRYSPADYAPPPPPTHPAKKEKNAGFTWINRPMILPKWPNGHSLPLRCQTGLLTSPLRFQSRRPCHLLPENKVLVNLVPATALLIMPPPHKMQMGHPHTGHPILGTPYWGFECHVQSNRVISRAVNSRKSVSRACTLDPKF